MLEDATEVPDDRLDRVRQAVRAARDLRLEIEDLRGQVSAKNVQLTELLYTRLPEVFRDNGVREITLAAEGNQPAFRATLADYYHANIAGGWDQDRQDKAYNLLEDTGRGDLIKRTIEIKFGMKENELFKKVYGVLSKIKGVKMTIKRSVPWNSLTAMIRESYESGEEMDSDELHTLGATVGQIVHIKEEK
jgi:hypothetical protein